MEQKINKTFDRAMDEINTLQKAFKAGGLFEKAVAEIGGNIAWFNEVNEAFDKLSDALEESHMGAVGHLGINEGRMGFKDLEKLGAANASKVDQEARRRGSADMEPGDADQLRYKVAKEMGLIKESKLTEGVLDGDDDDGFMARSQLYFLARDAINLHGIIDDRDDLEPWVQSKIAQASQGIDAVRRYTEYNAMKGEMPGADMDVEESKSQGDSWYILQDAKKLAAKDGKDPDRLSYGDLMDYIKKAEKMRGITESEGHSKELLMKVVDQMIQDAESGDYTAIDDLLKNIPQAELEGFLSELDEGLGSKVAKYALAGMLGLGAVKGGLDATSAKHSPLGQALNHASQNYSGPEAAEATELYNMIDALADEDPSSLRYWASQNQDLINKFKESTMDEGSYGKKKKKKYYEAEEEKHYMCVHAKKGTHKCTAGTSYEAAKKAAELWGMKSTAGIDAHLMEGFTNDAQRKAAFANGYDPDKKKKKKKSESVEEATNFDDKRNGELKSIAKDLFAHAKAAAEKKVK